MTFKFVCQEHEDFGSNGWRLKSQPDFDPLGGMAVAHDCLEHFSDSAEPHDEFMALGASLFIRGHATNDPGVHIASDLPDILRHITEQSYGLRTAPRTYACSGVQEVDQAIASMFRAFYHEQRHCDKRDRQRIDHDTRRSITSWMRIGYRRARRRYHNRDGEAQNMFCQIERDADKFLKHAEEGDELHVIVRISQMWADVKLNTHAMEIGTNP